MAEPHERRISPELKNLLTSLLEEHSKALVALKEALQIHDDVLADISNHDTPSSWQTERLQLAKQKMEELGHHLEHLMGQIKILLEEFN